jgi:integrase
MHQRVTIMISQQTTTFEAVAHRYLRQDKSRSTRHIVRLWVDRFADQTIDQIAMPDALDALDPLRLSPSSRGKYLAILRAVLNYGRDLGLGTPKRIVVRRGEHRAIDHLNDSECTALIAAAETAVPHLHIFVLLCLHAGARPREALNLAWKEVDLDQQLVRFWTRKGSRNGERRWRSVDLHPRLATALGRAGNPTGRVVNDADGKPYDTTKDTHALLDGDWQKLIRAARIRPVTRYALRHTFATRLRWAGMELDELAKLLGHATITQTAVYAHIRPGNSRSLIRAAE